MTSTAVTVFLPCHTLDDFPTWLEEAEADELLTAWTAAWHPAVIAAAGGRPGWASVDLRPPADGRVGVVPAFCDDRFAAQLEADDAGRWVRGVREGGPLAAAIVSRLGGPAEPAPGGLPGEPLAEEFQALGLATLLAELLARRMRTDADLAGTGFDEAVVNAARGAVAADEEAARAGLRAAHACLEATRARYYPVESWALDLVLVAPTTSGERLVAELASPVPLAVVATGQTIRRLAERSPGAVAALREAVAAGRAVPCGGRDDERPLDACSPEEIRRSFASGRAAWREHVGAAPACHAAISGGSSAILPQLLRGHGYSAAVWSLFDGTPLPDPAAGRIRWEAGGAAVEAAARSPLDAGSARTVLALADRLGDALDHDHVAVIQFARYAGSGSRWHDLIRRIGSQSGLCGSFVTPSILMERSAGAGTLAGFEPDAFAPTLPAEDGPARDTAELQAAVAAEAERLLADREPLLKALAGKPAGGPAAATGRAASPAGVPAPAHSAPARATPARQNWLRRGLFRGRDDDARALDNGLVRLVAHPRTGGLLSLRRPADRGNRISQQVALRSTTPAQGRHWLAAEDRAVWTRMEADAIDREDSSAEVALVSRGRLLAADGRPQGRFSQRMTLLPGLPLAVLEIAVELAEPVAGPIWESHLACRFAWHENEDVSLRRSLHLQSVPTDRSRFTAPHFIQIDPDSGRTGPGDQAVTILTGGLAWHLRASPHVVDCLLPGGEGRVSGKLGVGIGLERPWEAALALAAGDRPTAGPPLPANVRLTAGLAGESADRPGTLQVGVIESAGRAGEVRLEWARPVARAVATDLEGHPLPDVHVVVEGRATVVFLDRYQWLHLALEFAEPPAVPGRDSAPGQERTA